MKKVEKFDDVRVSKFTDGYDLNQVQGTIETPSLEILKTLSFNENTIFSNPEPATKILQEAKTPPLGIKEIHKMGITGNGVNVAIIDQPLALDHPEYKGKIASYTNLVKNSNISSMHGPAVVSLLVGENLGTAPDAKVYYWATPTWEKDARYEVKALEQILEVNKTLPENKKIKFVSVSAAPGMAEMRNYNNLWNEAVKKAQASGLCVVECTEGNRFVSAGWIDNNKFYYGFPHLPMKKMQQGQVHVPNSHRTIAESYDNKHFSYIYSGVGGLSWGIPYAVGILCLGQQLNPSLSANELKQILIDTAQENNCIVNPQKFLEQVKLKNKELWF